MGSKEMWYFGSMISCIILGGIYLAIGEDSGELAFPFCWIPGLNTLFVFGMLVSLPFVLARKFKIRIVRLK